MKLNELQHLSSIAKVWENDTWTSLH